MKKARILLASIAVVGILGGAFAFKAANRGTIPYYINTSTTFPTAYRAYITVPRAVVTLQGAGTLTYWTTVYGAFPTNYATITANL